MQYTYKTHGVCSKAIHIDLNDQTGKISDVVFDGGCPGNLLGIGSLIKDADPQEIIARLKGTKCGAKATSCPEQLAIALEEMLAQS